MKTLASECFYFLSSTWTTSFLGDKKCVMFNLEDPGELGSCLQLSYCPKITVVVQLKKYMYIYLYTYIYISISI